MPNPTTAGMTVSFPSSAKMIPVIQIQPKDLTVPSEQDFCFFWLVAADGTEITDDSTGIYFGTSDPVLRVTVDIALDGTTYDCIVANNLGSVTSDGADLTVT